MSAALTVGQVQRHYAVVRLEQGGVHLQTQTFSRYQHSFMLAL